MKYNKELQTQVLCTSARLVVNAVKARARDKRVRFGDELIIPITDLVLMNTVNKKNDIDTPVPIKARSRETNALFISEQPLVNVVLVNVILVNVVLVNVILVNVVVVLVHPSKLKHIDKRVTEGLDDRQEVGGGREEELT